MSRKFTQKQIECINDLYTDMIVSAGAGTGKTRILTHRYINLIDKTKTDVKNILCITFTNKAAIEMKDRISELLYNESKEKEQAAEKTENLIKNIEHCQISTIHSFCSNMLREFSIEAELDPEFSTIEDIDALFLKEKLLQNIIEKNGEKNKEIIEQFYKYIKWPSGYNNGLVKSMLYIYDKIRLNNLNYINTHDINLLKDTEYIKNEFKKSEEEITEKIAELYSYSGGDEKYTFLLNHAKAFYENIERNIKPEFLPDIIFEITEFRKIFNLNKIGKKQSWEYYGDVKECFDHLKNELIPRFTGLYIDLCFSSLKLFLYDILKDFNHEYLKAKSDRSIVDYDDLLEKFYRLIKENKNVRKQIQSRFKYILVDEYQDINYLQKSIIDFIKGNGNLFVVGDVKQSIYSFRNADYRVFLDQQNEIIKSGGKLVELDKNFRSREEIVSIVNFIFEKNWYHYFDFPYDRMISKETYRANSEIPSMEIIYAQHDIKEEGRKLEACLIAKRIKEIVENGEIKITDKDNPDYNKPLNYKDFLLLFRNTAGIHVYEKVLNEEGIPFYTYSSRGFFETREVLDVENFLRIISNPYNEIFLASVLKSPMFFINDETLFLLSEYARNNGLNLFNTIEECERINIEQKQITLLKHFLEIFDRASCILRRDGLKRLISYLYESTGILNKVILENNGLQKYANLKKIEEITCDYSKNFSGIQDFIDIIKDLRLRDIREGEALISAEDENVVKLMTVHSAKGLEAPVVILPDISKPFNLKTDDFLFNNEVGIGLKLSLINLHRDMSESYAFREIKGRYVTDQQGEEIRLLYVAMTRAKEYLILSGSYKNGNGKGWADMILDTFELSDFSSSGKKIHYLPEINLPVKITYSDSIEHAEKHRLQNLIGKYKDNFDNLEEIKLSVPDKISGTGSEIFTICNSPRPEPDFSNYVYSVSELIDFSTCIKYYYFKHILRLKPDISETSVNEIYENRDFDSSRNFGIFIHKAFELINFKDISQDLNKIVDSAFCLTDIDEDNKVKNEVLQYLEKFRNSDIFKKIAESRCIKKEESFVFRINDINLNGKFDLFYINENNKPVVIDYKSNKTNKLPVEKLTEHYYFQMWLYSEAVKAISGIYPEEIYIYFIRLNLLKRIVFKSDKEFKEKLEEFKEFNKYYRISRSGNDKCEYCYYSEFCV